jgi:hypothetical protein
MPTNKRDLVKRYWPSVIDRFLLGAGLSLYDGHPPGLSVDGAFGVGPLSACAVKGGAFQWV